MLQRLSFFFAVIIIILSHALPAQTCVFHGSRFCKSWMHRLGLVTAESRILGSIPVTGLVVKMTIRERKNDNPSGYQVFICCHWKKHFEEEIKHFWLRGRGRFSTRLFHIHTIQYMYNTVLVCMYIILDTWTERGIQLEQACMYAVKAALTHTATSVRSLIHTYWTAMFKNSINLIVQLHPFL